MPAMLQLTIQASITEGICFPLASKTTPFSFVANACLWVYSVIELLQMYSYYYLSFAYHEFSLNNSISVSVIHCIPYCHNHVYRQNEVQINKDINFHSLSKKWFLWSTIGVLLSKCRVNRVKKWFSTTGTLQSIHVLWYPCTNAFQFTESLCTYYPWRHWLIYQLPLLLNQQ